LNLFFPPRLCEATVLQEGVGDHGHQDVTMKTLPRSPLEVIKPKLLFQLLMRLFANPSCLDGGG
jgi:hypothetical protein